MHIYHIYFLWWFWMFVIINVCMYLLPIWNMQVIFWYVVSRCKHFKVHCLVQVHSTIVFAIVGWEVAIEGPLCSRSNYFLLQFLHPIVQCMTPRTLSWLLEILSSWSSSKLSKLDMLWDNESLCFKFVMVFEG